MEAFDRRREVLTRVVREPMWQPRVASSDGETLKELEGMGWVVLEVVGYNYRHHLTEFGLERHRSWGDDRRGARRRKDAA